MRVVFLVRAIWRRVRKSRPWVGLGDAAPSHIPHEGLNLGLVVSGPEEVRRTVRQLIKYGVDSIKLNLSGEEITGMGAEETPMSEEEVAMAVKEAKCRNKVLSAHARSSGSVKQCVRHGIQNIYHASFADKEALDMLEANKDQHFVAPGIAWLINNRAPRPSRGASSPDRRSRCSMSASSKCASTP